VLSSRCSREIHSIHIELFSLARQSRDVDSPWVERARVHAVLADPHRLAVLHHVALEDRSPRDLAELLDLSMPLMSHHLKVLTDCSLVARIPSEHDRRQKFVTVQPSALAFLDREWLRDRATAPSGRVVFACTKNSARSVLAAALWSNCFKRPTAAGGTAAGSRLHPRTVRTARRHNLQLLQESPVALDAVLSDQDLLVTVCDAANEHIDSHPHRLHWSIPDPVIRNTDRNFDHAFQQIAQRIARLGLALSLDSKEEK